MAAIVSEEVISPELVRYTLKDGRICEASLNSEDMKWHLIEKRYFESRVSYYKGVVGDKPEDIRYFIMHSGWI